MVAVLSKLVSGVQWISKRVSRIKSQTSCNIDVAGRLFWANEKSKKQKQAGVKKEADYSSTKL
jgi:hypothetical protein